VQCRIPGFDYVAAGNSTNKKDAQSNAAKDMVQYLVRVGRLSASEVPEFVQVCHDNICFYCSILCVLVACLLVKFLNSCRFVMTTFASTDLYVNKTDLLSQ